MPDERKQQPATGGTADRTFANPPAAPAVPAFEVAPQSVPYEVYRRQAALKAQTEAATMEMDETAPGGKYLADDGKTAVDADGKPLKGGEETDRR
jgi:hypothetical protein